MVSVGRELSKNLPQVPAQVERSRLPNLKHLEDYIQNAFFQNACNGLSLAIIQENEVVLDAAWGWLDEDRTQPLDTLALFRLGPLTSIYTSVAILQLVTAERLYLTSPISEIYPPFVASGPRPLQPNAASSLLGIRQTAVDPAEVTVRHVLTHTSGLPDIPSVAQSSDPLEILHSLAFIAPPEQLVWRSDWNLVLLSQVIAALYAEPFERALQQHVLYAFESTRFRVPDQPDGSAAPIFGHDGLYSNALDVALFGNLWLHRSETQLHIDRDLHGAATELQSQNGMIRVGLGWQLAHPTISGERFTSASYGVVSKNGSALWIDPLNYLVLALLCDCDEQAAMDGSWHRLLDEVHRQLVR